MSSIPSKLGSDARSTGSRQDPRQLLHDHLRKTASFIKYLDILVRLLVWLTAAVAVWFLACVIDHWLMPLPGVVRWLFWLTLVGFSGWILVRQIFPLIIGRINPDYAALRIEHLEPEFKHGLISWLQLQSLPNSGVPRGVMAALTFRAVRFIGGQDPSATVDTSLLIKLLGGFMLLTTGMTLYSVVSPKSSFRTAQRIAMPWANLAAPDRVHFDEITPGNVTVSSGQPLEIEVRVRGLRSSEVVNVVFSTRDGQFRNQPVELTPATEGFMYRGVLKTTPSGIEHALSYRVEAGDAVSELFDVKLAPLPSLVLESVVLDYPAYTRLPKQTVSGRDVEAVEGTQVTVLAKSNQDLVRGRVELDPEIGSSGELIRARDVLAARLDGRQLSANWLLKLNESRENPTDVGYRIRGFNARGDGNPEPILHHINVLADLPPEIQLLGPASRVLRVRPDARVNLEVRAIDPDFGLNEISLTVVRNGKTVGSRVVFEGDGVIGRQVKRQPLDIGVLKVQPGDTLELRAAASDNRHDPITQKWSPNQTYAEPLMLEVVGPEEAADISTEQPNAQEPAPGDSPPAEQDPTQTQPSPSGQTGGSQSQDQAGQQQDAGASSGGSAGSGESGQAGEENQQGEGAGGGQNSSESQSDPANQSSGSGGQSSSTEGGQNQDSGGGGAEGQNDSSTQQSSSSNSAGSKGSSGSEDASDGETLEKIKQFLDNKSRREQSGGEQSGGEQSGGEQSGGEQSGGEQSGGEQSGGEQSGGEQAGDEQSGGEQSGNEQSGGEQSGGEQSGGEQSGGEQSGGEQSGGEQSGGEQSGGEQSGGEKSGGEKSGGEKSGGEKSGGEKSGGEKSGGEKSGGEKSGGEQSGGEQSGGEKSGGEKSGGEQSGGEQSGGEQSGGEQSGGEQSGGEKSGGEQSGGEKSGGEQSGGEKSGGEKSGGEQSGGEKSGGEQSGGEQSGGEQSGGEQSGGEQSGGEQSGGEQSGGEQSGGEQSGGEKSGGEKSGGEKSGGEQPGGEQPGGEQPGGEQSGGEQSGGEQSGSQQPGNQQSGSKQPGSGTPQEGSYGADGAAGSGDARGGSVEQADASNAEFSEQTTEMLLDYLNRQRDQPDPELLREVDWTQRDLERFVDRWNNARDLAANGDEQDKERWREMLKGLNLSKNRQGAMGPTTQNDDFQQQSSSATRTRPPESIRRPWEAFQKAMRGN